jgi:hypothetical protein
MALSKNSVSPKAGIGTVSIKSLFSIVYVLYYTA